MAIASIILGIVFIIGGVYCINTPVNTYFSVMTFFAVMLLVYGIYGIIRFFKRKSLVPEFLISIASVIIGFVYLLARKVISWHIPVSYIGCVFVLSLLMEGFSLTNALALILSGGLLIGAIFMATDYVTSPTTPYGKLVFGLGAGLITFLIRYFGIYPEGVSFAILFMNILTPYIEKLTANKVFGGVK